MHPQLFATVKEGSLIRGWLTDELEAKLRERGYKLSFVQFDSVTRLPVHKVVAKQ